MTHFCHRYRRGHPSRADLEMFSFDCLALAKIGASDLLVNSLDRFTERYVGCREELACAAKD